MKPTITNLSNAVPDMGIKAGSSENDLWKTGSRPNRPSKPHPLRHPVNEGNPMKCLRPPLVRRDAEPRHRGRRVDELGHLLVHRQPRHEVLGSVPDRQLGVAELVRSGLRGGRVARERGLS